MTAKTNTVLVTGGAGFIGSHLVEALLKRGYEVRVVDNFSTGRRQNLASCLGDIKLMRVDIRDFQRLKRAMRGVSRVFHLAAVSSVPLSVDDPMTTGEVNVTGTWNVLEAARLNGVKRVVFISSASVYGADTPVPFRESMRLRGSSPYAVSKLVGEQLCDLYWTLYGLETVSMRLFSVYGPRQNP
jgi:UDP-glucose 4-epimerase